MKTTSQKIIYDLGANNGDDIAYYLKKADKVVALEANPVLCARIRERFKMELSQGRLFLEACVLAEESGESVPFYVHRADHGLSQFPLPAVDKRDDFREIVLPAISVQQLFAIHGHPYYVKVDLEGFDEVVLRRIFELGIFPDYVSVEAHTFSVFCLLVSVGGYKAFKLTNFDTFFRGNTKLLIRTSNGHEFYRFPLHHSSGPCADDIPGAWMGVDEFLLLIGLEAPGWKDIHASRKDPPDSLARPHLATYVRRAVVGKFLGFLELVGLKKKKKYALVDLSGT
jgi:FkbM family methyltransferase